MPSEKVLIVDDERLVRWSLRQKCQEWGYHVLEAETGSAGLQLAHQESPDLVLLDVRLPDISGIEVLEQLKKSGDARAVIMITADPQLDDVKTALKLGAYDFVGKPLDFDELATATKNALEATRLRMARPLSVPAPLSKPHPKILVGGEGERKTLRLAARYADACNLFAGDVERVRRKLDVLRRHCDDCGRDYNDIERTSLDSIPDRSSGSFAADLIETCRRQAAAGIQHAIFSLPGAREVETIETLGREVVPTVAGF